MSDNIINGTCLVTNLPIKQGDKVVLFLLKSKNKNKKIADVFSTTDYYKLFPILLYGTYDDMEIIKNVNGDLESFYEIVEKELNVTSDVIDKFNDNYFHYEEKAEKYLNYIKYNKNRDITYVLAFDKLFEKLLNVNSEFNNYDNKKFVKVIPLLNKYLNHSNEESIFELQQLKIRIKKYFKESPFVECFIKNLNINSINTILNFDIILEELNKIWFPQIVNTTFLTNTYSKIISDFYNESIHA